MIIAINGAQGSGKDTLAKILQYYTLHPTQRTFPIEMWINMPEDARDLRSANLSFPPACDLEIKHFAKRIKECLALITGYPLHSFDRRDFKESKLSKEFGDITGRELMQNFAEGVKNSIKDNIWINVLLRDYKPIGNPFHTQKRKVGSKLMRHFNMPTWIIPDLRYKNEFEALNNITKSQGDFLYTIQIINPNNKHKQINRKHKSETDLNNNNFDAIIMNDGSIEDLFGKAYAMLLDNIAKFEKYFYL